jgi:hypothetical protein
MNIKASARSIVILVAGLVVFFAGPSPAATAVDQAVDPSTADSRSQDAAPLTLHKRFKHGLRHGEIHAHRKVHKVAEKPDPAKNDKAAEVVADAGTALADIPPSVANANAQLSSPGVLGENARLLTARASDLLQASPDSRADARANTQAQLVAADQLNDVDRSLRERSPPSSAANPAPAPVPSVGGESSTWDRTSLIGKIFIGFGALLTMASAARMFMA